MKEELESMEWITQSSSGFYGYLYYMGRYYDVEATDRNDKAMPCHSGTFNCR